MKLKQVYETNGHINQRSESIVKSWVYSRVYEIKPPGSSGAIMVK